VVNLVGNRETTPVPSGSKSSPPAEPEPAGAL